LLLRHVEDRSDDPEEPLRVYADPAGHPFCLIPARQLTQTEPVDNGD
jgi:hypothetical protein